MTAYTDKTPENKDHSLAGDESGMAGGRASAFQFVDNRAESVSQRKWNEQINNSFGSEQLKAVQLMADSSNRSEQQNTVAQMAANGNPVQMKTEITYEAPQKFTYGNVTDDVGTKATATLDPKDPIKGSNTAGAEQEDLMASLPKTTTWKKGHLLNHDLGGRGTVWNLFPITTAANSEHYHEVEKIVKHWLGNGKEAFYEITAEAEDGADNTNANAAFHCEARVENTQPQDPFHGHYINKSIKSHVSKQNWTRKFENKPNKHQNSFGSVDFKGDDNQVKRDQYGKIKTLPSWDNQSGNHGLNRPDNERSKGLRYTNENGQEQISEVDPPAQIAPVPQLPAPAPIQIPQDIVQIAQGNGAQNQGQPMDDGEDEEVVGQNAQNGIPDNDYQVPQDPQLEDDDAEEAPLVTRDGDPDAFSGEYEIDSAKESYIENADDGQLEVFNHFSFLRLNQDLSQLDECYENALNNYEDIQNAKNEEDYEQDPFYAHSCRQFVENYRLYLNETGSLLNDCLRIVAYLEGLPDWHSGKRAGAQMVISCILNLEVNRNHLTAIIMEL